MQYDITSYYTKITSHVSITKSEIIKHNLGKKLFWTGREDINVTTGHFFFKVRNQMSVIMSKTTHLSQSISP